MKYQNKYLYQLLSLTLLLFVSCSSIQNSGSRTEKYCNENLEFKKVFFKNVRNVETLIDKNQNKSFKNSLNFIGKYTYVNFESMTNYAGTYPIGVFDKDKKVWLNWYEKNKCKNIKIK